MDFIEKLRKKPKSVKKIILYVTSFTLLGIIILFWVATLPYRFSDKSERRKENSLKEEIQPLSLFKDNVSRAYKEVSGGLSNIGADIQSDLSEESLGEEDTEQNNQ